jgi:hypothetical protein
MSSYPVKARKMPNNANTSIMYSVSRPMYGASHNNVGFVCILALRVLALLSNCTLAGSTPLSPYSPESKTLNSHQWFIWS